MKIAFLSFYSGLVNRGVETFVQELSCRLGGKIYEGRARGTIIGFTLRVLRQLDGDTDIVIPTNGGWQTLLTKLWCLWHHKKIVISGHSGLGRDDRINLLCRPDCFIALTDYQDEWARKHRLGVRVEKIPNGVDLEKFGSKAKPIEFNLPKPVVLSVSALTKEKRLDLAIMAVAKTNASLVLVGRGPEEKKLQDLGNNLLPGRFKILSFERNKMPNVYRAADIFTYATVPWESFGIVLLEAMASGLPVVVSDDPIRREIVGEAGLFVDPQNTKLYAAALQKALSVDWGSKPVKQAEKFSWDKIVQKYEELFADLTASRR